MHNFFKFLYSLPFLPFFALKDHLKARRKAKADRQKALAPASETELAIYGHPVMGATGDIYTWIKNKQTNTFRIKIDFSKDKKSILWSENFDTFKEVIYKIERFLTADAYKKKILGITNLEKSSWKEIEKESGAN